MQRAYSASGQTGHRSCINSIKVGHFTAFAGTTSLSATDSSSVKVGIQQVVLHPSYNPALLDFDIALLELARPLRFGKYIQPICLPLAIHKFPVGRKCLVSGWGSLQDGNGRNSFLRADRKPGIRLCSEARRLPLLRTEPPQARVVCLWICAILGKSAQGLGWSEMGPSTLGWSMQGLLFLFGFQLLSPRTCTGPQSGSSSRRPARDCTTSPSRSR